VSVLDSDRQTYTIAITALQKSSVSCQRNVLVQMNYNCLVCVARLTRGCCNDDRLQSVHHSNYSKYMIQRYPAFISTPWPTEGPCWAFGLQEIDRDVFIFCRYLDNRTQVPVLVINDCYILTTSDIFEQSGSVFICFYTCSFVAIC